MHYVDQRVTVQGQITDIGAKVRPQNIQQSSTNGNGREWELTAWEWEGMEM